MDLEWDCVVVGGGAAGMSAALVLGRARQRTLVIDAASQSNLSAPGIGGLLGSDGRPPEEFYATGRRELATYPSVEVRPGEVVRGQREDVGLSLDLGEGSTVTTRRVLLAMGMDYRYAEVEGIAERWGRSAFHCPFCHGWEHRDGQLGVLDRGETGVRRSLLLREWSDEVTLFTNGAAALDDTDAARLHAASVEVEERTIAQLRGPGSSLTSVAFTDGAERSCTGLLVPVTLHQRSDLAAQLGVDSDAPGPVAFDAVAIDAMYNTSAPGISAAGDVSSHMPSVASAVAAGSTAAAMMVHGLVMEDHGLEPPG